MPCCFCGCVMSCEGRYRDASSTVFLLEVALVVCAVSCFPVTCRILFFSSVKNVFGTLVKSENSTMLWRGSLLVMFFFSMPSMLKY